MYFDRDKIANISINAAGLVQTSVLIWYNLILIFVDNGDIPEVKKVGICWFNYNICFLFVKLSSEITSLNSDLISWLGIWLWSWSLSNKIPLLWFNPLWTFLITKIFANNFKSINDIKYLYKYMKHFFKCDEPRFMFSERKYLFIIRWKIKSC